MIALGFGQQRSEGRLGLHLSNLPWQHQREQEGEGESCRHPAHGRIETKGCQQHSTEKETHPLEGVLGTREDGHPLEQLLLPLLLIIRCFRHHRLDGTFGAHLVEVFGDAADGLGRHHINDAQQLGPTGCDRHQHQQRKDLQQRAHPESEAQPVTGPDPTAIKVGDHPEELVEEKQGGNLQGGVAELVEMEHHQHPQRTIGEREGPVVGGDDAVLLQGGELHASSSTTWQVRSAMREL